MGARSILLLGVPEQPWEIEDAFPESCLLVAPGGSSDGNEMLMAELWGRSIRLEAIVARSCLPSPEVTAFLVPEALVLVDSRLAKGEEWHEFLEAPWIRKHRITVQLTKPGMPLTAPFPGW